MDAGSTPRSTKDECWSKLNDDNDQDDRQYDDKASFVRRLAAAFMAVVRFGRYVSFVEAVKKAANEQGDLIGCFVEREMSGVEDVDFRFRHIVRIGGCPGNGE